MTVWKRFIPRSGMRRSTFIALLVSHIVIFLLPVAIGAGLYGKVEGIMVENAVRSNKALLEQVRLAVDGMAAEVGMLSNQIALNPRLQWLLDSDRPADSAELYKFIEFMKELQRYGTISSDISDFYVYFANTDTVLTPSMRTNSRMFYEEILGYKAFGYDAYRNTLLDAYHFGSFLPSASLRNDVRVITYAQSLPLGERSAPKGLLVILIDEKRIRELLEQIEWANQGAIYILNRDREVMMTTADVGRPAPGLMARLAGGGEVFSFVDDEGRELVVTSAASEQNGWTYVSVVPRAIVLEKVELVKSWAIAIVLACLLGGAAASYGLASINYRPVRELVSVLLQRRSPAKERFASEFDFIKKSVASALDEERRLQRTISRQAPVIQADFLSRLVRGHVDASSVTEDDLRFMGVRFRSDRFCIVLADVGDGARFMRENSEKEWALLRFVISNLGAELLGGGGYALEMELNRVLFLIHLPEEEDGSADFVPEFAEKLNAILAERFKIRTTLAVSRVRRGLDAIPACYGEAIMAMDYKLIRCEQSIIRYDELEGLPAGTYHYPTAAETQLMNFVKSGDFAQAETLLNQIYDVNFRSNGNGLTPEMGRCLFFNLLSTYYKLAQTLPSEAALHAEPDPAKWTLRGGTAEEMFRRVKASFRMLCERFERERPRHGDLLFRRITEYVNEHLGDSGLSLTSIADHFDMNAAYLSSFFKKHGGENVSDYIARIRVAECRRLLRDTSLTLSEIAERVGYANSVGLIRIFKKLEGITPGQYREAGITERRITSPKNG